MTDKLREGIDKLIPVSSDKRFYRDGDYIYRISQKPNGKYYNDYDIQYNGIRDDVEYLGGAGDYNSFDEAERMLYKHRPNAKLVKEYKEEELLPFVRRQYAKNGWSNLIDEAKKHYEDNPVYDKNFDDYFMDRYRYFRELYNK